MVEKNVGPYAFTRTHLAAAVDYVANVPFRVGGDPESKSLNVNTWVWDSDALMYVRQTRIQDTHPYLKTGDDTYQVPRLDVATHDIRTITHPHAEIHEGCYYTAHYDVITANVDGHRTAIGFQTPDTTKWGHMTFYVSASVAAEAFIIEAPTIDLDDGTSSTIYNRNRNSNNTSVLFNLADPQVAGLITGFTEAELAAANFSGGTELDHIPLVGGSGPKPIGGNARDEQEWLIMQNTKYLVYIQNVGVPGAAGNWHALQVEWYEQVNKEA